MTKSENRWRVRVALADRPGALAALATTLAVHNVDILRIDVVAHGEIAVDDLWVDLPADEPADKLNEVLDRLAGVSVLARYPVLVADDPVSLMAAACAEAAQGQTPEEVRVRGLRGARRIAGAEQGVLLGPLDDGSLRVWASSIPHLPDVAAHDPCLAREAASFGLALGAQSGATWAPSGWAAAVASTASVAAVPLASPDGSVASCMLLLREKAIAFQPDELTRLYDYARALSALLRARGEFGGQVRAEAWFAREPVPVSAPTS